MNIFEITKLNIFYKVVSQDYKKKYIWIIFLTFLSTFFELYFLKIIYTSLTYFSNDLVEINDFFLNFVSELNLLTFENSLILAVLIIFFLKTIIQILHLKFLFIFNEGCAADLRLRLFNGYMNLPKLFRLRSNIDEKIKNLNDECQNLSSILVSINTIFLELAVVIASSIYLMTINFESLMIILISFIFFSIFLYLINSKPISNMSSSRIINLRERLKLMYDGLTGANVYELTGTKKKLFHDFNNSNEIIAKLNASIQFRRGVNKPIFEILLATIILFVATIAFKTNQDLNLIIPQVGVFLVAGYRLLPSIVKIISSVQLYSFFVTPFKKIAQEMEMFKQNINETNDTKKNFIFKSNIKLKNISFSYNKSKNEMSDKIFNNNIFEILKEDKVGILGKSGVGKSTLLDILMALIQSDKGEVLIDEVNVKNVKILGKRLSDVFHKMFLTDDSIKMNIAFGKEGPNRRNKIKKAIQQV